MLALTVTCTTDDFSLVEPADDWTWSCSASDLWHHPDTRENGHLTGSADHKRPNGPSFVELRLKIAVKATRFGLRG